MAKLSGRRLEMLLNSRPPEVSEEDAIAALRAAGHEVDVTRIGPPESADQDHIAAENRRSLRGALAGLPAAAGMVGGTLASPFGPGARVAAAGAGGIAGRSLENTLASLMGFPAPQTPAEVLSSVGQSGMEQSEVEMGGGLLNRGANVVARELWRRSLNPSPKVLGDFPKVLETAARERIPVSSGFAGSRRAEERLMRSAAGERANLQRLGGAGRRFSAVDLANEAIAAQERELGGRALTARERAAVVDAVDARAREMLQSRMLPGITRGARQGFTPDELLTLRQEADELAKGYYNARAAGAKPPAGDRFARELGSGARRALREGVPEIRESSARTQELMGLRHALRQAEARKPPTLLPLLFGLGAGAAPEDPAQRAGGAIGTMILARMLMDPRTGSRAAIALGDPYVEALLQQLPRAAWLGIQQQKAAGTSARK